MHNKVKICQRFQSDFSNFQIKKKLLHNPLKVNPNNKTLFFPYTYFLPHPRKLSPKNLLHTKKKMMMRELHPSNRKTKGNMKYNKSK